MDSYYNNYSEYDSFSYNMIDYLVENDDMIWKLLKYSTFDAWNKSNLTKSEKGSLIYDGSEDISSFRVFMDGGPSDAWTNEVCILKIYPYGIIPDNKVVGTVEIALEVYCHFKINHLNNYKTRIDMVVQRLLSTFNGSRVGGIGNLFFDRLGDVSNKLFLTGSIPFKGKWISMSNKVVGG